MESLTNVQINSLYHRLMSKIEKRGRVNTNMSPCWINNYKANKHGYSTIGYSHTKKVYSHRFMWWYSNGKPDLKHTDVITHDCDNPNCCNPGHLKLGNAQTNMQEAVERGLVKVKTKTKSNKKGNVVNLQGFIGLKGEDNNNAKLNWEKVREIRTRHSLGLKRGELKSMTLEYNVSYPLIRKVISGTFWKEIT
jgi:hypothetical protein